MILLHGQGDNRAGMIGYAQLLLGHGFLVLMPDARAHGQSGGTLSSYGLLESADLRRGLDWLVGSAAPAASTPAQALAVQAQVPGC